MRPSFRSRPAPSRFSATTSTANLISTGLFGDGAAAVVAAGADCDLPGIEIVDTRSTFYPDTEDVMGWDISEKGFSIVLSPDVPKVARERLGADIDGFLVEHGLDRRDIGSWLIHTGGPKVLEAVQQTLGVDRRALAVSWESLRRFGNLSSASVPSTVPKARIIIRSSATLKGADAAVYYPTPAACDSPGLIL